MKKLLLIFFVLSICVNAKAQQAAECIDLSPSVLDVKDCSDDLTSRLTKRRAGVNENIGAVQAAFIELQSPDTRGVELCIYKTVGQADSFVVVAKNWNEDYKLININAQPYRCLLTR